MLDLIDQAEREQRGVILLPTAASAAPPAALKLLRPADARETVQALQPRPWPADHEASLKTLAAAQIAPDATVVWLSDGMDGRATEAFGEALGRLGHLRVVTDAEIDQPLLLRPPVTEGDAFVAPIERAEGAAGRPVHVQALAENGAVLATRTAQLKAGERTARVAVDLPTELRNRVARLEIDGEHTAGGVVLLDERWRRRPVGLVSTGNLDVGSSRCSANSIISTARWRRSAKCGAAASATCWRASSSVRHPARRQHAERGRSATPGAWVRRRRHADALRRAAAGARATTIWCRSGCAGAIARSAAPCPGPSRRPGAVPRSRAPSRPLACRPTSR